MYCVIAVEIDPIDPVEILVNGLMVTTSHLH